MLCLIPIVGGLLIMMGQHDRSEALFYYFRLEDRVPENHLLRLIEKHISFEFVRERLRNSYSETGRPSIDPELLLRILLIGYLYGITSERKLVEELRMHLAWRWFTGLGFDQEIPHHSTFSKNRHGRFQESKLFEQLFEQIVKQCVKVGLIQGKHLSVDGSFVEANAAKGSRIPREQLVEAAQVHHTVYAHAGQYSPQKQSALRSRAFFLSSRKQQLPLSRRAATQLWWTQCSEPYPRLHRDPQTLWGVRAKSAMHQLTVEVSCHSHP